MTRLRIAAFALVAAAALTLTACASADSADDAGAPAAESTSDEAGESSTEEADAGSADAGGVAATITVDGQTWEYPSYLCVTGYENTSSDVYSFSSTSFTTVDGEQIQVLVDVRDESGEDRVSGEGVVYEITLYDTENASVDIQASGTEGVTITDTTVDVDGAFTDIDGTEYSIRVEATCAG